MHNTELQLPLCEPKQHKYGFYVRTNWKDSNLYLRRDGTIHEGVGIINIKNNGWFSSKEQANEAIAKYKGQFNEEE